MKTDPSHSSISSSFSLTLLFFLSKSSTALFSLYIVRSRSFFGVLEKNLTPIDKNAHMIWALFGFDIYGSSST